MGLDKLQSGQSGIMYYWRVRGIDEPSGVDGVWSSASNGAFAVHAHPGAPRPTTQPANDATVAVPTLKWEPVTGALSYHGDGQELEQRQRR